MKYEQNPELGGGWSHMDFSGSTAGRVQGVQRPLLGRAEGWSQAVMGMVRSGGNRKPAYDLQGLLLRGRTFHLIYGPRERKPWQIKAGE